MFCLCSSFTSESEPSSIATVDPWTGNRRGSVSNGSEDTESEREYGTRAPSEVRTNVTLKRQQDSETSEFHLDGYGGNVKRHESHVFLNDPVPVGSARSPFTDVVLLDAQRAGLSAWARSEPASGQVRLLVELPKDLLAEEGYDPIYGARPLKRVIQQRIQNSLANEILSGRFEEGTTITVDATPDGFVFGADGEDGL